MNGTTHTFPDGASVTVPANPRRRPRPVHDGDPLRCRRNCPGGRRCCLCNRDGSHHKLCICDWSGCACHGQARYEEGRRP